MRSGATVMVLAVAVLAATVAAQHQHGGGAGPAPSGGVTAPGWKARLDRANQSVDNLSFMAMGTGVHAMTGPAAIFWKPDQTASGSYTVSATFSLPATPPRAEGYGLFVGGGDLEADGQRYTYFLIRHDGKVIVKRRQGTNVSTLLDWTDSAAVKKPDAGGKSANVLSVKVTPATVSFLVNGQEVHSQPASAVDTAGIAGLRVNHGLNVMIDRWAISKS